MDYVMLTKDHVPGPSLVHRPPPRFYLHGCNIKSGRRIGNKLPGLAWEQSHTVVHSFLHVILIPWCWCLYSQ